MDPDPCQFVLNNSNKCICKTSYHNVWKFGERGSSTDTVFFDDVNSINPYNYDIEFELSCKHYSLFNSNMNETETQEILDICKEGNYVIHCSCSWCTYSKNKHLNIYNECFCCKEKLYISNNSDNNEFIRCADCNSILCRNCFIQGRYNDITYCYDCRKFSIHKNQHFYFTGEFCSQDDWDFASFYY